MTQSQRKWTVLETVASIAVLATSGWAQGLERVSVTSTGGEPNDAFSRPVLSGSGDAESARQDLNACLHTRGYSGTFSTSIYSIGISGTCET